MSESNHARLAPSNHRWPKCPGSVREEAKYQRIAGEAAIDGTGSHVLLELCLQHMVPAKHYKDLIIGENHTDKNNGWLIDEPRCNRVQMCLDYVKRREEELKKQFPDCDIYIEPESRSNPGLYTGRNDWWGTCDVTIIVTDKSKKLLFLEVADYKDGRMYVSEKWNSQLLSYLLGKLVEWNHYYKTSGFSDVGLRMTIIQPKSSTPIRYMCSTNPDHGLNEKTFITHVNKLVKAAQATDDPNAELIPGDHCQWCSHNPKQGGNCSTMVTDIMDPTKDETGLIEYITKVVSDIKSLTPDQLSKIADTKPAFSAIYDKVFTEIELRIKSGDKVPGYAMQPGNSKKVWVESEEEIIKKLKAKRFKKDDIFPPKLITPAAALKNPKLTDMQRKKLKEELISEVAGEMTLKKVGYDHQEEKNVTAMFGDVKNQDVKDNISPGTTKTLSMTEKANGATYQQFIEAGWTDEQMIEHGMAIEVYQESFI